MHASPHPSKLRRWLALGLAAVGATVARAQETPVRVRTVTFEGREWIPAAVLLEASGLGPGAEWTEEAAVRALEGLRRLEFIGEVGVPRAIPAGAGEVDVVIPIEELPVVVELEIEGADAIAEGALLESIATREGRPLRPETVAMDREAIETLYQEDGFLLASVALEVETLAPGRAALLFRVEEGHRARIADLEVMGNVALSTFEIARATGLEPVRLFGLLERGYFRPRELGSGLWRLGQLYRSRGYLEAQAGLEDVAIDRRLRDVRIVLRVEEGPRYRLDEVRFEGNQVFGDAILAREVDLEPGEFYSGDAVERARRRLFLLYQERSDRVPRVELRHIFREDARVVVVFEIDERTHIFIGRVDIEGNWRTRDRVIRAASTVRPGEPLTAIDLDRTRESILALGFFSSVEIDTVPAPDPRVRDVRINVVEKEELFEWQLGGGASSGAGEVAYFRLEHPNFDLFRVPRGLDFDGAFSGGGQRLAIEVIPGTRESQYSFTFVEPYLLSAQRSLALSLDTLLLDRFEYDEDRLVFEAEVRQALGFEGRLAATLAYTVQDVEIDSIEAGAPPVVAREKGHTFLAYPRVSLRWADLETDLFSGPSGTLAQVGLDLAHDVTGSEADFVRVRASADLFQPFFDRYADFRHLLRVGIDAGWVDGLGGESVPFYERFFTGGPQSFRGFEYRRLGPHEGDVPVGGRALLRGTVQYSLPVYFREIRAVALFDWGFLEERFGDVSGDGIRTAAGGGIELRLPVLGQILPVNLYWVHALASATGDEESLFSFTLGYGF